MPVFMALMQGELRQIALSDFWWHLRQGQLIWSEGRVRTGDLFSFTTPGAFAPTIQWLGDLYLYACYTLGGLELVILADALVLALTAWLTLRAAREAGAGPRLAGLVTAAAVYVCVLPNGDARPQLLGFPIFALWSLWLLRHRRGKPAPLWLIFPTAILWINVNGTMAMGGLLLAGTLAGEWLAGRLGGRLGPGLPLGRLRAPALALASLPLAVLVNPWGPDLYRYLAFYAYDATARQYISEWRPLTTDSPMGIAFYAFLLLGVGVLALTPRRANLGDILLFLGFGALAIQSGRNLVWFGIVAAPLVAGSAQSLAGLWPQPADSGERPALNYALAGCLVVLGLLGLPWWRGSLPLPAGQRSLYGPDTPVAAVAYAAEHYAGERFFHPYAYGGYIIWAAYGSLPVFIDGRYNHYVPAGVMDEYLRVSRGDDWETILEKYGIDHVLVTKDSGEDSPMKPLLKELRRSPDWQQTYEDEHSFIFVREAG